MSRRGPIRYGGTLREGLTIRLDPAAMGGLDFLGVNVKEAFTLTDETGAFFRASLRRHGGREGEAEVYERLLGSPESPARITLVCAILNRQRMILVTQKATELGCTCILPVFTDRSVQPRDLEHEKPWAWQGQAIKGARQCRRAVVPEVCTAQPLVDVLAGPVWRGSLCFALDDRDPTGLGGDPLSPPRGTGLPPMALAVGPEGGWSDRERDWLRAQGTRMVRLGVRVMRAETAVFAGLSILQHRFGDLDSV